MEIALVNPHKRRKAKRSVSKRRRTRRRSVAKRAAAPRRRRVGVKRRRFKARGFKRNPIAGLSTSGAISSIKTGLMAASGAIAVDAVMGFLPIPDSMKVGPIGIAAKAAGAIGIGFLAGRFLGRATGVAVTEGALTILAYNVLKPQVARFLPGLAMGEYVNGMGEYVDGLGYLNPAPIIGYDGGNSGFGSAGGESFPIAVNVPTGFGGGDDADPFGLE